MKLEGDFQVSVYKKVNENNRRAYFIDKFENCQLS